MRPANASGSPSAALKGSTVTASAPPSGGGERRDRAAHDVSVRIAPRHHAPGGLGRDDGRADGASPQASSTRVHSFPQAAKLSDGEKLVLVRGEPEEDVASRGVAQECLPPL